MLGQIKAFWQSGNRPKPLEAADQITASDELVLDEIAAAISRRGLRTPAMALLETGHPLTFLGGQLLWISLPALALFVPAHRIRRIASMLEEPEAIKALVARLEAAET